MFTYFKMKKKEHEVKLELYTYMKKFLDIFSEELTAKLDEASKGNLTDPVEKTGE